MVRYLYIKSFLGPFFVIRWGLKKEITLGVIRKRKKAISTIKMGYFQIEKGLNSLVVYRIQRKVIQSQVVPYFYVPIIVFKNLL